jgi:gamma-glutamyltranspeptidase/glutathione hydrolase
MTVTAKHQLQPRIDNQMLSRRLSRIAAHAALALPAVFLVALAACSGSDAPAPGGGPGAEDHAAGLPSSDDTLFERGVVAAPEQQAAEVGAEILRRGGNAVDAAVAVQFALCVTNAYGAGLGGGGFMLVSDPREQGMVAALDYREMAPAGSTRDMFLDDQGNVILNLSTYSPLAAAVPGTVRGMAAAWERYGSLPWADLLAPAVRLARDGFTIDRWTAWTFEEYGGRFDRLEEPAASYVEFGDYYGGNEGSVLKLPDLARTLQRIAEEGPDEFYTGRTADLLVEEMKRDGGLITAADLAAYKAVWREPYAGEYRGHRVVSMPPPSSGGVAVIQFLNMLEAFDLPEMHSPGQIHLMAEIAKRVFADRASHLGDPDYHDEPMLELIDKDYGRERAAGVDLLQRSDPASIKAGVIGEGPREGTETTHFSIVDRNGMAVANTTTLNTAYGSGVMVDGAGFLLNSQMDDFSAKPGVRNYYGVTGSVANEIVPGKRPLSSMTPTMVFGPEGDLMLVLGSPGGPTIISSVLQVILHVVDYGNDLEVAINLPRFHHQWPPSAAGEDLLRVETDPAYELPEEVTAALVDMGYTLKLEPTQGDIQAVAIDGRQVTGIFDRRRTGGVAYQ